MITDVQSHLHSSLSSWCPFAVNVRAFSSCTRDAHALRHGQTSQKTCAAVFNQTSQN